MLQLELSAMLPCSGQRELILRGLVQALMHLVLLKLELVLQLDLPELQVLPQHFERRVVSELVGQVQPEQRVLQVQQVLLELAELVLLQKQEQQEQLVQVFPA
jgi:hypothetical protein